MAACAVACERKNGDPVDLGPEVSVSDVNKALAQPLAGARGLVDANVSSYVAWRELQTLAATMTVATADVRQTIDARDDQTDPDYVLFTVVETKLTYSGKDTLVVVTERDAEAKKPKPAATAAFPEMVAASARGLDLREAKALAAVDGSGGPTVRVSYHNLKTGQGVVAAPDLVRARPGCGGLSTCSLRLFSVEFDRAIWTGNQPDKMHVRYEMSPDVPALATLMNRCMTLLAPVGESKTLVTACSPVVDFSF